MSETNDLIDLVRELQARNALAREARLRRLGVWRSMLASPCDDVPFGPERLTLREHKQRVDDYVSALLRDDVDAASTAYQALQPLGAWWRSWADRLLFTVPSPSLRHAVLAIYFRKAMDAHREASKA